MFSSFIAKASPLGSHDIARERWVESINEYCVELVRESGWHFALFWQSKWGTHRGNMGESWLVHECWAFYLKWDEKVINENREAKTELWDEAE